MSDITVRSEHPSDRQAIDVIHLSAFGGDAEAQFVAAARDSADYIPELSLVAEYKHRLVGHLMLSHIQAQAEGQRLRMLALAPMAVVPSQSYRGIGGELLAYAIAKARDLGYTAIAEVGQTDYYQRHGFKPVTQWGIEHSLPLDDALMTVYELVPGTLRKGLKLVFPPAFVELVRQEVW